MRASPVLVNRRMYDTARLLVAKDDGGCPETGCPVYGVGVRTVGPKGRVGRTGRGGKELTPILFARGEAGKGERCSSRRCRGLRLIMACQIVSEGIVVSGISPLS